MKRILKLVNTEVTFSKRKDQKVSLKLQENTEAIFFKSVTFINEEK